MFLFHRILIQGIFSISKKFLFISQNSFSNLSFADHLRVSHLSSLHPRVMQKMYAFCAVLKFEITIFALKMKMPLRILPSFLQAIQKFNGQKLQNRPIAVDWAVPKNLYSRGNDGNLASEKGK